MATLHDEIKASVINELDQFCMSGDTTVDYYRDSLDSLVDDAIAKVEKYLNDNYPGSSLIDYFNNCGNEKSLELVKDWDFNAMLANGTYESPLDWLYGMLEDNLPYMIACGMLGNGRGLWELFDSFPQLNTLV
jgi:hypothetical protein